MSSKRRTFLASLILPSGLHASKGGPRSADSLEQQLMAEFASMEIADSHEHILDERERIARRTDFFDLLGHYTIADAVSAGMPEAKLELVRDKDASDAERWRAVAPYWEFSGRTGYSQCLRTAIRDIHGFDEITEATAGKINDAIRASNKPGLHREILKRRARIRFYVQDDRAREPTPPDPEFFVIAREFDSFVVPGDASDIASLEELSGISITTLRGLTRAAEAVFLKAREAGMVAVKTLLAAQREILFREAEEPAASRSFEALMRGGPKPPDSFRWRLDRPYRDLEDYMFHQVMRLAEAHSIPVQIHTGLNAILRPNFIVNANPVHLTNLFFLYPRIPFDLFHMGYPYFGETGALAKTFPNVHIDFCWTHIISPEASRRALREVLDLVPSNKIVAFGGDFNYAELAYAHAKIARQNVAHVLAGKVRDGQFSETEAVRLGQRLLHDNASRLFWPGGNAHG